MSAVWALPVPEDGMEPKVGQFAASEPTPFSHLLDMYAQQFASLAALPPHYVGLLSDGNPASAEAIIANDSRLVRRVERKQTTFGAGWKQMARHVLAYRNGGTIPDNAKRLELEWADAATPNLAGMTDALQKQIASGMVPAASDVVLRKAGYSAIDRLRLEVDRKADQGSQVLAELANSMQAKQIRAVTTVDKNLNPNAPAAGASSSSTPTPTPSANAGSSAAGK
jgi:hypothetical protein